MSALVTAVFEFDGRDRGALERAVEHPLTDDELRFVQDICAQNDGRQGRGALVFDIYDGGTRHRDPSSGDIPLEALAVQAIWVFAQDGETVADVKERMLGSDKARALELYAV